MTKTLRFAALLAALALLAVGFGGCGGREETPSSEAEAVVEGQAAESEAAEPSAELGTEPGQIPPPFTLPDLEGNEVSLSDFEGSVVILDLWATWCPPCRKEIPFLVSLYREFHEQGLEIVGVGLDQSGAAVIAPFVEGNEVSYTILVGDQNISRAYRVSGIPMTMMIGRDGKVAWREVGFATTMEEGMRAKVVELLAQSAVEA